MEENKLVDCSFHFTTLPYISQVEIGKAEFLDPPLHFREVLWLSG